MKKISPFNFLFLLTIFAFSIPACNSTEEKVNKVTKKDSLKKENSPKEEIKATRPGIINISDTISVKKTILYMKDSAAIYDRIGIKLGNIYGVKLSGVVKKAGLKMTGQPIAWYKTNKAPYFFEAGIPVDKKPAKLPANTFIREISVDSAVVAHFYGPYNLLPDAYEAVKEFLKERHRKLKGTPYEIYVGDPMDKNGKPIDPYKVQTDIVFHWE